MRLPTPPSQCLACHAWPCADVLCTDCMQRYHRSSFRCTGCAIALPGLSAQHPRCGSCLRHPPIWQQAHAWMDYHYPWNHLLTRWKFGQQPALAQHFAHWMGQAPQVQSAIHAADVVLPIPLSKERMRERGYNTAAQLAQQLAPRHHQLRVLVRSLHTTAQSDLPRAQRLRNLRHAFAIAGGQTLHIDGKKVLLIDDVMTTGATFTVASRCLLQAGAARVDVLCMARTP